MIVINATRADNLTTVSNTEVDNATSVYEIGNMLYVSRLGGYTIYDTDNLATLYGLYHVPHEGSSNIAISPGATLVYQFSSGRSILRNIIGLTEVPITLPEYGGNWAKFQGEYILHSGPTFGIQLLK